MVKVYETAQIEFLKEKSVYNESTDFMNHWKPALDTDHFGRMKDFLENINKNYEKLDSMNDVCASVFLHVLSLCLVICAIIILALKRSGVYALIFAGVLILAIAQIFLECKKRDELRSVTQDIKVHAEMLKLKTQGQLEIIIISPSPKGGYLFSIVRYVIKLIIKYQEKTDNKLIQVYRNDKLDPVKNDPFLNSELKKPLGYNTGNPNDNNLVLNQQVSLPKEDGTYNLPMQEVDLYEDKQAKMLSSNRDLK